MLRHSSVEQAIANCRCAVQSPRQCQAAWWSLVRFTLSIVLIGLALSVLATPWVDLSWWKIFRRCASIAAAVSLWLCIKKFERNSFHDYGFSVKGAGKRQLLLGLLLGAGMLASLFGPLLLLGSCRINVTPDHLKLWRTLLGFLPVALTISVLEELVFRGYILQNLLACSRTLAISISSGAYALVHLKAPEWTYLTALELGGLFLLGGVLALSYLGTRKLYVAVGMHAALAYGARVNKLLFDFHDPTIAWLVGTSRLVNGILGWVVLLIIGGIVVWWTRSTQGGGACHEHS